MKWNMVFGALVVSVGLCSQSFGFELLDRMLGLNDCGCNSCCTAQPSCGCDKGCEPGCAAIEPGCCAAVDPGCGCAAAEPACGCAPAYDTCCAKPCRKKCHRGLLHGLHDAVFGSCHKNRCHTGCASGCAAAEPACAAIDPGCGCPSAYEPACAAPAACGCAAEPACNPCNTCCKKRHCGLLGIFHHKKCRKPACSTGCAAAYEPACGCAAATGCAAGCGASVNGDVAPADDAAPMPPAPTADPSASVPSKRRVVTASSKVVQRN